MVRPTWSVQDAKNRFSEVVEAARRKPQTVTSTVSPRGRSRCRRVRTAAAPRSGSGTVARGIAACHPAGWRRIRAASDPATRCGPLMYLIDTVVVSELRKPKRDTRLTSWVDRQRTSDLFISVVTVGEIERGIVRQRAGDADFATALAAWLDRVLSLYGERVLPFDLQIARRWGRLSAALGNDSADLMIAATALEHGLTVVTRNVSDRAHWRRNAQSVQCAGVSEALIDFNENGDMAPR